MKIKFTLTNPFRPPVPEDPKAWQVCADLADFVLLLEQARRWHLIDSNGKPNVKLCQRRLCEADTKYGLKPRPLLTATSSRPAKRK